MHLGPVCQADHELLIKEAQQYHPSFCARQHEPALLLSNRIEQHFEPNLTDGFKVEPEYASFSRCVS